jgi:hypothetical protein
MGEWELCWFDIECQLSTSLLQLGDEIAYSIGVEGASWLYTDNGYPKVLSVQ